MASFVSAFDEAPKTPTRSFTSSKKVVVASPENTPPSSPSSKSTRRSHGSRMPFNELTAGQISDRSIADQVSRNNTTVTNLVRSFGAMEAPFSSAGPTDTFSNAEEASEVDVSSVVSQNRFDQIEQEVSILRDELKTLNSQMTSSMIQSEAEPEPLLAGPSESELKVAALEDTIARMQLRMSELEARKQEVEASAVPEAVVQAQVTNEVEILRTISTKRMETLVSSFFPFLTEQKSVQIARWMTDSIDFSVRNTMRRVWSLILIIDLLAVFVQSRFPQAWKQLDSHHIPRGWYKRISAMRYCLEMLLVVQFGIAAQQLATSNSTINFVKSAASRIYSAIHTIFVKYLPTGLVLAATASFAAWLYRNRLAHQMLL